MLDAELKDEEGGSSDSEYLSEVEESQLQLEDKAYPCQQCAETYHRDYILYICPRCRTYECISCDQYDQSNGLKEENDPAPRCLTCAKRMWEVAREDD